MLAEKLDAKLGRATGIVRWRFDSTAAIMEEVASVTPSYAGMRHAAAGRGPHLALPGCGASRHTHPAHGAVHAVWASCIRSGRNSLRSSPTPVPADPEYGPHPLSLPHGHHDSTQRGVGLARAAWLR
ncbi:MAG: hypothetical protein R2838_14050 [Caldilineaceae bacterium]